jgi:hypothetical protein
MPASVAPQRRRRNSVLGAVDMVQVGVEVARLSTWELMEDAQVFVKGCLA